MLAESIERQWDARYSVAHVRKILHALGFSLQFPRERLALAVRKTRARWLKRTLPAIEKWRASDAPS